MPSPIRLIRRWTRKNPTAGASIPTTAPVANASRMKSVSKMDMGRVVPGGRKLGGVAVEDDAAADEHQPLDEALDGSELVRDEKDRHGEIAMKSFEQRRERFLRVGVDTGSRFVEHEQIGLGREGLRDEGALLLATGEPCDDGVRVSGKADAGDRLVDRRAVAGSKSAENAEARNSTDGGNLSNGDRRVDHQLGPLWKIGDARATTNAIGVLAVEEHFAGRWSFQTEPEAQQGRLATTVWPGDRDELSLLDLELDIPQHRA